MTTSHKLIHGDCLKCLPALNEVACIFADPPDGIGGNEPFRAAFFLGHDERVTMVRRVFGFASLGALGVILVNILIYVAVLAATVLTIVCCLQFMDVL